MSDARQLNDKPHARQLLTAPSCSLFCKSTTDVEVRKKQDSHACITFMKKMG